MLVRILALLLFLPTLALAAPAAQADLSDKAAPAWGAVGTATIRPGAEAETTEGFCTFNFLFYDNNHAYVGTAAHCTDRINDRVKLGATGQEIGTVVYDSDRTAGADADVDFTLVRLDANRVAQANPEMLGWCGPTGIAPRADLTRGEQLDFYGYGILLGSTSATRERSGVLVETTPKFYRADMPAVNGDSGAPLLEHATGRAAGIISHYGIGFQVPTTDEGPLMTFVMSELAAAGFNVTLATVTC